MNRLQQVGIALIFAGAPFVAITVLAQDPPSPTKPTGKESTSTSSAATARRASARRSVVQHYQHPYPGYYHGDSAAGFRNPGGIGRHPEYYPPDEAVTERNSGQDPVRVAKFDEGGGAPSRQEQLQSQQIGIQRQNSIQNHIDNYSRPYIGYGVGFFGGYY